ncbi:MAG TPA: FAD-binding protein [Aestuariivirgaceae bacterium]|nr:FAD-binding protein [Aestuariivirgaceae bacterium]
MAGTLRPQTAEDLAGAVAWAVGKEAPVEIVGTGTKRGIGRAMQTSVTLDISALSGVEFYEPDELVLKAGAGTRLSEVEELLAGENQQFAFEPPDLSRLLGSAHAGTLGGMVAANFAGPRRIKAGAVRDHLLGFTAVSGRGETFKSGSRVMKNVTGYDLSKLMAGSWGTLAVLADTTFKALPAPETEATVMVAGLADDAAAQAMSAAMQSAADVSGAAYLPADMAAASQALQGANGSVTLLRIEGVGPSVEFRAERLHEILSAFGTPERLDAAASRVLWIEVRDVHCLTDGDERLVWRISVPPMQGPRILASLRESCHARGFCDWAGGLVWLDVPPSADASAPAIRDAISPGAGHATLIRAPEPLRASIDVFHPQPPAMAALTRRVRQAFDPLGLLNPGRMYS